MLRMAVLLFAGFILAGCTGDNARVAGKAKVRIGMMPKLVGISFFDATERGAREAAADLGIELIYDGPTEASAEKQKEMIDARVAQGVDVIAVAPNDPEAISSTLSNAKSLGAKVITWDTDANASKSGRSLFVCPAPAKGIADALIDVMVSGVGEDGKLKGKFLFVSGTQTAANQNSWMKLVLERVSAEHPECQFLETLYPGEDQREAQVQTSQALGVHQDLKGIFALTSVALPAAAKAIRDAGRDDVYVTGLSLPSLMNEYVESDTIEKFVLFDAEKLGYLTVHVAARLHDGDLPPGEYDFGKMKNITVTENEVILGKPLIFHKENIGEFSF